MMKGEKMVKRSSFGMIRKRLSDITNLHSQHKSHVTEKESAPPLDESSTKDYIQQLLKVISGISFSLVYFQFQVNIGVF